MDTDALIRKRILVVDDEKPICLMIRDILGEDDYEYLLSDTTDNLRRRIDAFQPDLLILDVMVPGAMDGFGACQMLKSLPAYKDLPVLMLTAVALGTQVGEEEVRRRAGADAVLFKPFRIDGLVGTVEKLLNSDG